MREPISRDSASPRELAEALKRLDRALEHLEGTCAAKALGSESAAASAGASDAEAYAALESDHVRLAAELDAARARERQLELAAAAASKALGRAAADVRAVLDEGQGGEGQGGVDNDPAGDAERASKAAGEQFNEEAA
jgi:hypothetical protein